MLPVSWALLRSSRAHLSRSSTFWRPRASSFSVLSLPGINYGAGALLRFRQAHFAVEQDEEPRNATQEYPIDVVNTQATIRHLTRLISAGNLDEASQVMTDFFAAIPTETDGHMAAFRRLKPALVKNPRTNLPLLLQFGHGYASMGYVDLVKEELLPLVRHFGSPEQFAHFELELDFCASPDPVGSEEVESTSEMDAFIDEQPPEREAWPPRSENRAAYYPEESPSYDDLSQVFEPEGDEYRGLHPPEPTTNHSAKQSTGVLFTLVQQGQYDQAYDLLQDIQELDAAIPPSFIYERAAIAAVNKPGVSTKDQVALFTAWFSLIPPEHLSPPGTIFARSRHALLQSNVLHVSILIQYALILAQKGYADRMNVLIIPPVMRATSPEVGRLFLDEYIKANDEYLKSGVVRNAAFRLKRSATSTRGLAVRSLAFNGRLDEAMALLPDPEKPQFRLTTYTYNVLLRRLWILPKAIREKDVKLVKFLRSTDEASVPAPSTVVEELSESESLGLTGESPETAEPVDFGDNLVAMLRYLKKHIAPDKRSETTHPFTLVNFMSMYLATGRTVALKMLLEKAISKSFFATGNFLFAEMLFYRRLKQPNLVIKAFMDHFYVAGVPREEVITRYIRIDAIDKHYDPFSGDDPPLHRFYPFDPSRTLPRGKLWPRRLHCNLVWDALVQLTTEDKSLELLYKKLVSFARDGVDSSESPVTGQINDVPLPAQWHAVVGAASFTPFMHRLMFHRGPAFGARILREMLQLGIRPSAYHYTELAGFYARIGDEPKTFLILDGMERSLVVKQDFPNQGVTEPVGEYRLPPPTLVTYTSILRGFLIAKHLEGAEKVYERMIATNLYTPGLMREADLAIKDLQDFKKAGANWVYPFGRAFTVHV